MLYKPSNPSPYNSVVDYNTDNLSFTASCISTSDIGDMRLAIKDDSCEYYLPVSNAPWNNKQKIIEKCISSSGISIPSDDLSLDDVVNYDDGYKIATSNYTRTAFDKLTGNDKINGISDIIKPLKQYRWQVRLYEKDKADGTPSCNINIGYGFVNQAWNNIASSSALYNARYDTDKTTHILKIRPHTNMFWHIETNKDKGNDENQFNSFSTASGLNSTQKNTLKNQLTSYWDSNVKYQIEINGGRYDITAYYYSNTKNSNTSLGLQTDSYGQPLFAYVEIEGDSNLTISENDEYAIYTNYIDSNEYYFSCRELGKLTFTGPRITGENKEVKFVSIEELDKNPDDHIYSPTHSNVQIKGSFDSSSSATLNYYKATLYQVLSNGEDIQIHDSGYVYSSEIDYDCKDLLNGNLYKLVISVADTYGNTVSQGVYIKPNCGAIVKPTQLSVESYREHGSVILDFGKLLSISGHLSGDNLDDEGKGYQIGELTSVKGEGGVFNVQKDETTISLLSADTNTVEGTACYIYPNNTVSYSAIDNSDEYITCTDPLVNIVFRCNNSDTQTIFELESSHIHYWTAHYYSFITGRTEFVTAGGRVRFKLTWDNYRFHLLIFVKSKEGYPFIQYVDIDTGNKEYMYAYPSTTLVDKYYTPYEIMNGTHSENEIITTIQNAISGKDINYSVPYLSYDNIKMDENSYVHIESAARDFWWHTVISKNKVYIKCINPSSEYSDVWQYQENISISKSMFDSSSKSAILTLYGGCAYYNVAIEDGYTSSKMTEKRIEELYDNPFVPLVWNDNSVLLANFKNGLEGGNYDGSYNNVTKFRIYKTHSNQPEMHKIYETNSANETIVEDFTVGSECDYTYYIVPVCQENGVKTTGSIIKSDPITLHDGTVRVIGLKQDDTDLDTYYIDTNNVWNISFNISNTGFQNNMGKTYNDTPQRFPIEIKNKGFYRTFNINGLLGKFDCDSMQYVDTYDDIIEWEKFVDNGEMKLIIDLRGVMTVGTMESNSIDYSEAGANMVSVNFSIRQLADINNITILNRNLLFNPTSGEALLMDANGLALQDSDDKYLIVEGGE